MDIDSDGQASISGQSSNEDSSSFRALSPEGSAQAQIDSVLEGLSSNFSRTNLLLNLKEANIPVETAQLVRSLEALAEERGSGEYSEVVKKADLDPQTEYRLRGLHSSYDRQDPELAEAAGLTDLAIELYQKHNKSGEVARLKQQRGDVTPLDIVRGIDNFENHHKYDEAYDLAIAAGHPQRALRTIDKATSILVEIGHFKKAEEVLGKTGDETRVAQMRTEALAWADKQLEVVEETLEKQTKGAGENAGSILEALRSAQKGNLEGFPQTAQRAIEVFEKGKMYAAAAKVAEIIGDDFQQLEFTARAAQDFFDGKDFERARQYGKDAGWPEMEKKALLAEIDALARYGTFAQAVQLARKHGLTDRVETLYEQVTTDPFATDYFDLLGAAQETGSTEKIIPAVERLVGIYAKTDEEKQAGWRKMMTSFETRGDFATARACAERLGDTEKVRVYESALQLFNQQAN